jgi:hypothetical protein
MDTPSISITSYSLSTLEDTPRRALELMTGISASPAVGKRMAKVGYTLEVHTEGLRLLGAAVGTVEQRKAFRMVTSATHVEAMNELVAWNKTVFRRIRATVTRFFPEQADALFANLELSDEMNAALAASLFLERLTAVEGEGKGSRGHAMVKVLSERGFGPKEIRHARKLIEAAQAPAVEDSDPEEESEAKRAERLAHLAALRAWYNDWAETARTVLVRRDHAIRVGLAHRKQRSTPVAAPVATAPPAAPVSSPANSAPSDKPGVVATRVVAANDTKVA